MILINRHRLIFPLIGALLLLCGCSSRQEGKRPVYECDLYQIFTDSVAQPPNHAAVRADGSLAVGSGSEETDLYLLPAAQPAKDMPVYSSGEPIINYLYNEAVATAAHYLHNQEKQSALSSATTATLAGYSWLAFGLLSPEEAAGMLRRRVREGRVIQNPSVGGSWPIVTDRSAWATAAWQLYLLTGSNDWLNEISTTIERMLEEDSLAAWLPHPGLLRGAASDLTGINNLYPDWMTPVDLYNSVTMSNNLYYLNGLRVAAKIEDILRPASKKGRIYRERALEMSATLRERLWLPQHQRFSAFLYGGLYPLQSPQSDNLAQALSILFEVATPEMTRLIVESTPTTNEGILRFFPFAPGDTPQGFNPLTQCWWNTAMARRRFARRFTEGIAATLRAATIDRTATDSISMAVAIINLVHKGFFGMEADTAALHFYPLVPEEIPSVKKLEGIRWRNSILDITMRGTGSTIARFTIDSVVVHSNSVPAAITGRHSIDITLANNHPPQYNSRNITERPLPPSPKVTWITYDHEIVSPRLPEYDYLIYENGSYLQDLVASGTWRWIPQKGRVSFIANIAAERERPRLESYSAPLKMLFESRDAIEVEAVRFSRGGSRLIANRDSSRLYVELTREWNRHFRFVVIAPEAGNYLMDFLYTNGSTMDDGGTKCAIRTLCKADGSRVGTVVMPQRGAATWKRPYRSNMLEVTLKKGRNEFSLDYIEPQNINMHGRINSALLRSIRIIRNQ